MTDVVVLERDMLSAGTTWHAAGEIVPAILGGEWECECELYTFGRELIGDALAMAQRCNAFFAAKSRQNDANFLLGEKGLSGFAANVLYQLISRSFAAFRSSCSSSFPGGCDEPETLH